MALIKNEIPILETDRLILRPVSVNDAQDIFDRWTSDPVVARYMRWTTHQSVEDTKQWLLMEEENNKTNNAYQWGFYLKDGNYLFGSGGLVYHEDEKCFELGYNIMHKYWNQGYTTEAAKAILEFAHKELGQKEFMAQHAVENPASGAVMEKCGFVYEKDGQNTKFDGVTTYNTRCYRLKLQ